MVKETDTPYIYILDKSAIYSACFIPEATKVYESYACLQQNFLTRFIFRFLLKRVKDKSRFYNPELRDCGNKTIIAFDTVDTELLAWIRLRHPHNRMIVYFINTVRNPDQVSILRQQGCELWSFDKEDCEKYGMRFNERYYVPMCSDVHEKKYGVSFVGREKSRRPFLNKMKQYLKEHNISYYFHITHERNYPIVNPFKYKKQISYEKMLIIERQSEAILEIVEPGQDGSTLRVLDAAFNNVKLITNYGDIRNSDLYDPDRVFIVKEMGFEGLSDFMESPFKPCTQELLDRYSYDTWIKHFEL